MSWALDLARHYGPPPGGANVFGVVVYTDADANLKKALRDEDYWQALNEVSGPKWTVLSVRAIAGQYVMPTPCPGTLAMMRMVWKEPAANRDLLETFGLDSTKHLPALVLFTVEGEEHYRTFIKLEDSSPASAFVSLRAALQAVTAAIEGVAAENLSSGLGVMTAINYRIDKMGQRKRLANAYKLLSEVKGLLPL